MWVLLERAERGQHRVDCHLGYGHRRGEGQVCHCPFDGTQREHNVDVTIKRRSVKLLCTIRINGIYIICSCVPEKVVGRGKGGSGKR